VNVVLCGFACQRQAIKQLKNGKWLCAAFVSQCPALRSKNAQGKLGLNPFANRPHPRGMKGKAAWNRGKTWVEMYGVDGERRQREFANANIRRVQEVLRSRPDIELRRREKLSAVARHRGLGRYRAGSGRGRKGRYKGFWCDSSYELAFVAYALDHGWALERNWRSFAYEYEGAARRWIPDFRFRNGVYIAIKGYVSPQAQAKFAAFEEPLLIFTKDMLYAAFDYVIGKYGRSFVRLYE
jgi:hypothetical protein